jgi:hypothetical protein
LLNKRSFDLKMGLQGSFVISVFSDGECFVLQVANFLGTDHHEFHFTVQEGIDAVQVR